MEDAIGRSVDPTLSEEEHLEALRVAMFAPGNDPRPCRSGWRPDVARSHRAAAARTPVDEWWTAGSAPVLVVQGVEDAVAPLENARLLVEELGERARVVEVPGAGHALVVERPEAVATAAPDSLDAQGD